MSDSHLHLYPHRKGSPLPPPPPDEYALEHIERYVEKAATRGVTELAFTEHLYRCVEAAEVLGPFWEKAPDPVIAASTERDVRADQTMSLERYIDVIVRAKDAGLPVLLGLEVDFFPETIEAALELIEPYPFDILLGSIHWIDGWWFDRPHSANEWDRRGHRRVYEQYFEKQTELAASGVVDVITHSDRVKYLGHRLPEEPIDLYEELLTAAVSSGVAMEVNTGGLRHPIHEIYPAQKLLCMARDAGVDITFASDGHSPEQAGWGLDVAREAAWEAGYTHRARFVARRRTLVPFDPPPPGFRN
ncbi:MAG: histidinol-phosphatase HisJ family protein [Acidimicrobiia bacterium]